MWPLCNKQYPQNWRSADFNCNAYDDIVCTIISFSMILLTSGVKEKAQFVGGMASNMLQMHKFVKPICHALYERHHCCNKIEYIM